LLLGREPGSGYGDGFEQRAGAAGRTFMRGMGWRGARLVAKTRCLSGAGQSFTARRGASRLRELLGRSGIMRRREGLGRMPRAAARGRGWAARCVRAAPWGRRSAGTWAEIAARAPRVRGRRGRAGSAAGRAWRAQAQACACARDGAGRNGGPLPIPRAGRAGESGG